LKKAAIEIQTAVEVQRSSNAARHPQINRAIINGLAWPLFRFPMDNGRRSARARTVGQTEDEENKAELEDEDEYDTVYRRNQQTTAIRYAKPVTKRQRAEAAPSGINAKGENNAAASGL
jgi:hypothetical protein